MKVQVREKKFNPLEEAFKQEGDVMVEEEEDTTKIKGFMPINQLRITIARSLGTLKKDVGSR